MESKIKRVRVLLRVSSDQQLEADGDLGVQRKIGRAALISGIPFGI